MRTIMKQMVKRAVMPSPIKRNTSVAELERSQSILYKMAVLTQAEEKVGIRSKRGTFYKLLYYYQGISPVVTVRLTVICILCVRKT